MSIFKLFGGGREVELVRSGDVDGLNNLLSKSPQLIHRLYSGRSLLHIACATKNQDMVLMLILRGADIDLADGRGRTPLVLAIEAKDEDMGKLLVDRGANLRGALYLHLCSLHGNAKLASYLVDCGCDINEVDGSGDTPLLLALRVGSSASLSTAVVLIEKHADLSARDKTGLSALDIAQTLGYIGIETAIRYHTESAAAVASEAKLETIHEGDEASVDEEANPGGEPRRAEELSAKKRSTLKKSIEAAVVGAASEILSMASSTKQNTVASTITGATPKKKKKKKGSSSSDLGSETSSQKSDKKTKKSTKAISESGERPPRPRRTTTNESSQGRILCEIRRPGSKWSLCAIS